jgi:hypothetical protein
MKTIFLPRQARNKHRENSKTDPVALHSAVSTTFRGFALAMFGRYRLYMHPPEDDADDEGGGGSGSGSGGRATFDEEGFRSSLSTSSAALAFFDTTFVESQLFDVRSP